MSIARILKSCWRPVIGGLLGCVLGAVLGSLAGALLFALHAAPLSQAEFQRRYGEMVGLALMV
jgi:hypothetical protein